jgi:hypothetical protein
MDQGGSGLELLSLKRLRKGGLGGPSLGYLEDMLRKSPNRGISVHRGPFITDRNIVSGGGAKLITGTLKHR